MEPVKYTFTLKLEVTQNSEIPDEVFSPVDRDKALSLVRELFKRGEDRVINWEQLVLNFMDEQEGFHPDTVVTVDVVSVTHDKFLV